jgi:hypothetical protein
MAMKQALTAERTEDTMAAVAELLNYLQGDIKQNC